MRLNAGVRLPFQQDTTITTIPAIVYTYKVLNTIDYCVLFSNLDLCKQRPREG